MPQSLTTHQLLVLRTLFEGGRVVSVSDEDRDEYILVNKNESNIYTRADTIKRLAKEGWIRAYFDHPAFGVTTWKITFEGRLYWMNKTAVKANPINHHTK